MNRKAWGLIACCGVLGLFAARAGAADTGFYVTASLGSADEDPKSNGSNFVNSQGVVHVDPTDMVVDDGSLAWSVGLGYRINRYLAGELEYIDFGTTDITEHYTLPNLGPIPFPTQFTLGYSSQVTGPAASLLGTLPVGRNFEFFLRGGVLFADRKITLQGSSYVATDTHVTFGSSEWFAGVGAGWLFAGRWGLRAEYQRTGELGKNTISGATRLDRASLSVSFRL